MKTKFLLCALMVQFGALLIACSDSDNPTPTPAPTPEVASHFDIWVSVGESSGMGSDAAILVKGVDSLNNQPTLDYRNDGADVTEKLYQESIIKGKYYYQVPQENDRFGKYQIVDNRVVVIAECPFQINTYSGRKYTNAWIGNDTLVIMAANGAANQVLYTKIDASNMRILNEGTLDIPEPQTGNKFSTSGLARYRKSDGKIIYAFQDKPSSSSSSQTGSDCFYVAFINASDMSVDTIVMENRAQQMAGTAYGELLQNKMFFDENDNLYIACNTKLPEATSSTQQYGRLLKIARNAEDFDKSYEGYKYTSGKLVTVDYMGNNKALLYIQDPTYTGADAWGASYSCYYAVLDLTTDTRSEINYNGKPLPYSSGLFSQRSLIKGGKAYIGVHPENEDPCVYIYDMATTAVEKGLPINGGYEFVRIVSLED